MVRNCAQALLTLTLRSATSTTINSRKDFARIVVLLDFWDFFYFYLRTATTNLSERTAANLIGARKPGSCRNRLVGRRQHCRFRINGRRIEDLRRRKRRNIRQVAAGWIEIEVRHWRD